MTKHFLLCCLYQFYLKQLKQIDYFVSAWLRRNCMEVFHWVAMQLKDVSLFSTETENEKSNEGAIYNDFDNENPFCSDDDDQQYSFTQPETNATNDGKKAVREKIQSEADERILEEQVTFFDVEDFDCDSETADRSYREKVFSFIKKIKHDTELVILSREDVEIYEKRYINDWQGADSIYDAWLIAQHRERSWFPIEVFEAEHPDIYDIVHEIAVQFEKEQKENDSTKSLIDTTSTPQNVKPLSVKRKCFEKSSDSEYDLRIASTSPSMTLPKRFKVKKEIKEIINIDSDSE